MGDGRPIDDLLRDASHELDRAAGAVARAAPSAEQIGRLHRRGVRRRRAVAAGASLAVVAGVVVVGALLATPRPSLVLETPPVAGAPPATADAHDDGEATGPGGTDAGVGAPGGDGAQLQELARLVEEGRQVPSGLAVTEEGRIIVVAVTVDDPGGRQARPLAWIAEADGSWRRAVELPVGTGAPPGGRAAFATGVAPGRGERLVVVGYAEDAAAVRQPLAWLSEDGGHTWTVTAITDGTGSAETVTWTGEAFVAAGATDTGAMLWVSPDGRSWSEPASTREGALAAEGVLVAVLAHHRTLVLVEQAGDASRLLVADLAGAEVGQLRQVGSYAGSLASLAADPDSGTLYAAGSQRPDGLGPAPLLLASSDGLSWEELATGWDDDGQAAGLHDAAVDGGQVVTAGTVHDQPRLSVLQSPGQAHSADFPADAHGPLRLAPSPAGLLAVGMIQTSDGNADIAVWRWTPRRTGS